jgi:L-aspartate oxidase
MPREADRVLVVGGGIAGLATALHLAPTPVVLMAAAPLGTGASTPWAQGGIAAALGPDDGPELHAGDTLHAGAGLSDPTVARKVAEEAPACIAWLRQNGVVFDQAPGGALALGLEGAHSHRRIVHANGDGTGRAVLDALIRAVRATPSVTVLERVRVLDLVLEDGAVAGAVCGATARDGEDPFVLASKAVVLATGGLGGLYARTTNPLGAVGSGLTLAARAGAVLRDLEFVQFHPTAIATGVDPMPLATEALRGEGAVLVNGRGECFMADVPGRELAPRDVVARAIFAEAAQPGGRVFLDARQALGSRFADRFPGVASLCRSVGIDPAREPIPVCPAAHYHMGGIKVDLRGRSTVADLWACGEVASTGLHGANRLASNSLLEALAFARWIADDIAGAMARSRTVERSRTRPADGRRVGSGAVLGTAALRTLMDRCVGVAREEGGLRNAVRGLSLTLHARQPSLADLALAGLLVATAALERRESRGAHCRSDFPGRMDAIHSEATLDSTLAVASAVTCSDTNQDRWQEVA